MLGRFGASTIILSGLLVSQASLIGSCILDSAPAEPAPQPAGSKDNGTEVVASTTKVNDHGYNDSSKPA